jgi:hypothetical protein
VKHNTKLELLPRELERFSPEPRQGLRFGIPALDAALPLGVPRGQITALVAPLGSGGTALLLALAEATLRADEGVVIVDAQRTLAPQAAAHLAALGGGGLFWVIRPRGTESAWWCADVLLRSGAFGLVVVDLAPAPPRKVAVRLQRLARDKDAALVFREAGDGGIGGQGGRKDHARLFPSHRPPVPLSPAYGAALRLTVRGTRQSATCVSIEKGGAPRAVEVTLGSSLPHRLRPHWAVRDRRGERTSRRSISGRGQRLRAATPSWPEH